VLGGTPGSGNSEMCMKGVQQKELSERSSRAFRSSKKTKAGGGGGTTLVSSSEGNKGTEGVRGNFPFGGLYVEAELSVREKGGVWRLGGGVT